MPATTAQHTTTQVEECVLLGGGKEAAAAGHMALARDDQDQVEYKVLPGMEIVCLLSLLLLPLAIIVCNKNKSMKCELSNCKK